MAAESTHEMPPGVDVGGLTESPEPGPVGLSPISPAPEEPVVEGPPLEPVPGTPPRAALDVLPPGFPSNPGKLSGPLAKFATGPAVAGDKAEEDKNDDGDGDCVMIGVSQVTPPHIVSQLIDFLNKLKRPGQYIIRQWMIEDVFERPSHVLCFQEPESDFGKDNHNIPQRLSQHPRLLEALLSPRLRCRSPGGGAVGQMPL